MRKLFILMTLLAVAALGCELGPFPKPPEQPEPPSPWDKPSPDAAPPPEDVDADTHSPCFRACERLAQLGCDEAKVTAGGATCVTVCQNTEGSGVVTMGPECVARAASCSMARHCGQ